MSLQPTSETRSISIEQEMRTSYLDYAMSVIVSRALPDVRDGLKPVQRRILWGMWDSGARAAANYRKSAGVVGDVLGRFHPHGDSAVYDALVRMAQDFSLRYPLVDGQGNFGSVDGDPAAAMRYTEVRMAAIAEELLADIDQNTVDFVENYDGRYMQPEVLPARVPNLLLNGSAGIAVGMATNIPPHNFNELADAIKTLIDKPDATLDDLLEHVKGPDFPTYGIALVGKDSEQLRSAYGEGHGRVTMRARTMVEEGTRGRTQIVVTELPYQVNKATLIEKIADLVRDRKIEGIADIRDESDRHGMRLVIELKQGGQANSIKNQLFKHTAMRSTFAINMMAIVDGQPRRVGLKKALEYYIAHRHEVIRRRTEHQLEKAREREHILQGLIKAIDQLDVVIATIRGSESANHALTLLQGAEPLTEHVRDFWSRTDTRWPRNGANPFDFTEAQARAILDMQLRRLSGLERAELQSEYDALLESIAGYEDLLANPRKIDFVIRDDIQALKKKYGDARRTEIVEADPEDFSEMDLVPHEESVITLSQRNYVKRTPLDQYRAQRRGGQGSRGAQVREEDAVARLVVCDTHDSLLVFTDRGRVYQMRGFDIPDAKKQAKGTFITNLIELDPGERVTTIHAVRDFEHDAMVLATKQGQVKKTPLAEFAEVRRNGKIAMRLDDGDELVFAGIARNGNDVLLVTNKGQAIRFDLDTLRSASRVSGGVRGIRLARGGWLVGGAIIEDDNDQILVVTEKGFGKRTLAKNYPQQGRGGQGVKTLNITDKTGDVAACRTVDPDQDLMLVTNDGIVMRTKVDSISLLGRATQGVTIMKMGREDTVSAIAAIALDGSDQGSKAAPAAKNGRTSKNGKSAS